MSKFRSCRVVLRDLDGAAARREIHRQRRRTEVIGVSDLNWIFRQQKATTLQWILSKSRTDFGMEASSRSPHFCCLCKLDDHILRDIGLTRDAQLGKTTRPFWR